MGTAGGTQQLRSSIASQHASSTQPGKGGGRKPDSEDKVAEWYKVIERLTELGGDLAKSGEAPPRARIQEVVKDALRVLQARGPPEAIPTSQSHLEARFQKLEEKIDAIASGIQVRKGQTWASIAAAPAARALPAAQHTAVRVRIPDAKGKTPAEILTAVKPVI